MSNVPQTPYGQNYPIPALPLHGYGFTAPQGRPGLITAVAVFSIILGSLGLLTNMVGMVQAMILSNFAGRNRGMAVAAHVARPPKAASTEYVPQFGLPANQRKIIIDGLCQVRPLNDRRRECIDALLADEGRKIFHFSEESLSAEHIAANVTEVTSLPSASGDAATDEFILGTGRLQVRDANAVFFPMGSPSPIRSEGGSITDAAGTRLASVQVNAVVDRVRELSGNAITSTQSKALEEQLQLTGQKVISPSLSVAGAVSQVNSAQVLSDGTIGLWTTGDAISIGPEGEIAPGIVLAAGYNGNGFGRPRISQNSSEALYIDAILSAGAGAFLLVAGIMTLKNSSQSRKLHLIYAVVKLLLVGLSVYAMYTTYESLNRGTGTAVAGIMAIFSLVYPVAILVVMNTRVVRDFYKAPSVGQAY